ncbi:MAG: hypothetical protein LBK66_05255 [Spirochaetaceae bacterium]|jgi:hypothetical protein|nr:hypothetical protein [Spirochaetaceae bacterium]
MANAAGNAGSRAESKEGTFKKKPYEKPVIVERSGMAFTKEILEELDEESRYGLKKPGKEL